MEREGEKRGGRIGARRGRGVLFIQCSARRESEREATRTERAESSGRDPPGKGNGTVPGLIGLAVWEKNFLYLGSSYG
jgi:hypothetical protein